MSTNPAPKISPKATDAAKAEGHHSNCDKPIVYCRFIGEVLKLQALLCQNAYK